MEITQRKYTDMKIKTNKTHCPACADTERKRDGGNNINAKPGYLAETESTPIVTIQKNKG